MLRSAAKFQQLVPGAVLVGESAAAFWARHRLSTDHDHTVPHLTAVYDDVLASLQHDPDWRLARTAGDRRVLILGEYGGVEAGLRQLRRQRPLDTVTVYVDGQPLTIPTIAESLRIKGFLLVQRNQVRDYLDRVRDKPRRSGRGRIARTA